MSLALWIVAGVLAALFIAAGASKVLKSRADLAASGQGWAEDRPGALVKLIGGLEILAAVGLILPPWTGVAPILCAVSATGIAVLMVGAAWTHARRQEWSNVGVNVVLLAAALFVAIARFGPERF